MYSSSDTLGDPRGGQMMRNASPSQQLDIMQGVMLHQEWDHLLVFTVADCSFALDVRGIIEVQVDVDARQLYEPVGPVTHSVPFRGFIIAGVSSERAFGVKCSMGNQMVVLDLEEQPVGLLVDRIVGLYEAGPAGVMRLPAWLQGCSQTPAVVAFQDSHGSLVLVLDGTRLFSRAEVDVLKSFG